MSESKAKRPFQRIGLPLFMVWGLIPALLLMATGLWLGQSGIPGPDSEDFPGPHLKTVLGVSLLLLFPWSFLLIRDSSRSVHYNILGAVAVTLVMTLANVFLAIGGCAAVDLTNEIFAFN